MYTEKQIANKILELSRVTARAHLFKDVSDFLDKYEKKVLRQHSDAKRKHDRLVKSGASFTATYAALKDCYVLDFQSLESQKLRIEILKRNIDILNEQQAKQEEVESMLKEYSDSLQASVDTL